MKKNFFKYSLLVFVLFFSSASFSLDVEQDQESIVSALTKRKTSCPFDEKVSNDLFWSVWFSNYYEFGFGFPSMWLYSKWAQVKGVGDYNNWFDDTVSDILGANCIGKISDSCKMQDCVNIKKFTSIVAALQQVVGKDELEKEMSSLDINENYPKVEYSIASLFTQDQLNELLKENIIHNSKLIYILSPDCTNGLFRDGNNYYFYDPNSSEGEVVVNARDEVAELIFSANDFDATKPSPLLFVMLSLDDDAFDDVQKYPRQEEVLNRINPEFIAMEKYAEGYSGLHMAASWGCFESVKYFLDKGVDPNILNGKDHTPLMLAAINNRIEIIELLLNRGADMDQVGRGRNTAIMLAIENNSKEAVSMLFEYGADYANINYSGETVFMLAARHGYIGIVNELIDKKVDVNAKNERGQTSLMFAAKSGYLDIVKTLLASGAEDFYSGAILCAARAGHFSAVKHMLALGVDPDIKDGYNETPLMLAIKSGYIDTVRVLLENGADPDIVHVLRVPVDMDSKLYENMTALMYAAENEYYDIIKLLLKFNADPNIADKYGRTPLVLVAKSGSADMIETLLKAGANPNVFPQQGFTALMHAVYRGDLVMTQKLLDYGAKRKKDANKRTVLMCAAHSGNVDLVKFFIDKGVNPNAKGRNGETALNWAVMAGHDVVVEILLDHDVDVDVVEGVSTTLINAILADCEDIVHMLLEKGADPNYGFDYTGLPIMYAVRKGNYKIVNLLIKYNVELNVEYSYSREGDFFISIRGGHPSYTITPLMQAIKNEYIPIVKLLLDNGAKPDYETKTGETALNEAVVSKNGVVVKMFVATGADVECKNKDGTTMLIEAMRKGDYDVIKMLIDAGANIPEIKYFPRGQLVKLLPNNWLALNIKNEIIAELTGGICEIQDKFFVH